jgi:hypothetical protein
MDLGRKGALLMLAVVVLWTAMPVSACLPAAHSTGQPDCCRGMEPGCDAPTMPASTSCCQTHQQSVAVATVPLYSPQHSQKLAFAPIYAGLQLPIFSGVAHRNAFETPPSKSPPGGAFALRI